MRQAAEVVVIGAGFAGVSTAAHLARRGVRSIVILEREAMPGSHASGLNAGMARQTAVAPEITPLAAEGVRFLSQPAADWPQPNVYARTGAIYLAEGADAAQLREIVDREVSLGLETAWLGRDDVVRRVPATRGGAFTGGAFGPHDGVVDIAGLLQGFLRLAIDAGARLFTGQRADRIEVSGGRVVAVETSGVRIETGVVVNAAGAWATEVAALAGAARVPLNPCRRHLFVTGALAWVDRSWPVVWDLTHGLYFRREPPGLLLSPCDEAEHPPGAVPTDPAARELLAAKTARCFPDLAELPIARCWAGLRTLTADGLFVLGPDPLVQGFFWCAGLGGHGMTVSSAVGRLVAGSILGEEVPTAHRPARFASGRTV